MTNIADSTENTADAIQNQATMCIEIQRQTDVAEEETRSMIDASKMADENVSSGSVIVKELRAQAETVEDMKACKEVLEEIYKLAVQLKS